MRRENPGAIVTMHRTQKSDLTSIQQYSRLLPSQWAAALWPLVDKNNHLSQFVSSVYKFLLFDFISLDSKPLIYS